MLCIAIGLGAAFKTRQMQVQRTGKCLIGTYLDVVETHKCILTMSQNLVATKSPSEYRVQNLQKSYTTSCVEKMYAIFTHEQQAQLFLPVLTLRGALHRFRGLHWSDDR